MLHISRLAKRRERVALGLFFFAAFAGARCGAKIQIGKKARPGPVTLHASNTTSPAVETTFTIAGEPKPLPGAAEPKDKASSAGTPEVTAVSPARVSPGSELIVKVTGKNFVRGAKVCFSNPAIRVFETDATKSTELVARIQVAADAPLGETGLFVVNPDDREVEVAFEVAEGSRATTAAQKPPSTTREPAAAPKPPSTPASASAGSAALRFEVLNLGEFASIQQNSGQAKGTLSFASGKLRYEEGGKEVFSAATGNIKEIGPNLILGVNTGTFHVILDSGKTYNFAAPSLRPADGQSIVDSLRHALP